MSPKDVPTLFYPGSGNDLSPLLVGELITEGPRFGLDYLQDDVCLVLCDRSPDIAEFFSELKPKDVLYDAGRGIMLMAQNYKKAWEESRCVKVTVEDTEPLAMSGAGSDLPLLNLILELQYDDGTKTKRTVHFSSSEFSRMKELLLSGDHNYDIKGLITLFTLQAREFFDESLIKQTDFIITDEAWHHLSASFFPTDTHFPSWSRTPSGRPGLKRTKLFLNKKLYPKASDEQKNHFHVIPNKFIAGLHEPNASAPPSLPENTKGIFLQTKSDSADQPAGKLPIQLHKIALNTESLLETKEAIKVLDKIDARLDTGNPAILLTDDKSNTLGLVIALWIVRHHVASGEQVFELLDKLSKTGNLSFDVLPKDQTALDAISNWLPGQ